jgi:hypothetical protein
MAGGALAVVASQPLGEVVGEAVVDDARGIAVVVVGKEGVRMRSIGIPDVVPEDGGLVSLDQLSPVRVDVRGVLRGRRKPGRRVDPIERQPPERLVRAA